MISGPHEEPYQCATEDFELVDGSTLVDFAPIGLTGLSFVGVATTV